MRGRKKMQNPKSEHIRISLGTRRGLFELAAKLKMPSKYKEAEIIEALIRIGRSQI